MTKSLKEFSEIQERKIKTDKELLSFMKPKAIYTTNDIQKYLDINHTATLGRLKKLNKQGYVELINERIYKWKKLKDFIEIESVKGYKFY